MYADRFFRALRLRDATYTDSAGSFSLRLNVVETDKAFRTSARDQLIGSSVTGLILTDARVRRGGVLAADGTTYKVQQVIQSSVPGLSDLKLERKEGAAQYAFDATRRVPFNDTITIGQEIIRAHVNESVETEDAGDNDQSIVVSRMMVAIRAEDAGRLQLKIGSRFKLRGKTKVALRVMEDGIGMVKILV